MRLASSVWLVRILKASLNLVSVLAVGVIIAQGYRILDGGQATTTIESASISRPSLVLVLQTDCPYCKASTRFYQELVLANLSSHVFDIVAAFPQKDATKVAQYLTEQAISPDRVIFTDPAQVGVTGTPAVLAVDRDGRVIRKMVGLLSPDQQAELRQLVSRNTSSPDNVVRQGPASVDHVASPAGANAEVVLDIRERAEFQRSRWPGSINVPMQEIQARYIEEISRYRRIAIVHRTENLSCATDTTNDAIGARAISLQDGGSLAKRLLIDLGHSRHDILIVDGTPPS